MVMVQDKVGLPMLDLVASRGQQATSPFQRSQSTKISALAHIEMEPRLHAHRKFDICVSDHSLQSLNGEKHTNRRSLA